ncbi:uncharacterized protein BX664DRAFT_310009 [Halteromyces radiatus]|uniref:uncharacterized protein n=1 Tax=Halteromyces radiatus TaxID=101107 RepID=UPI002220DB6E|nr:uncharacterized protein BX664DRAFT_310009 [Halteromyces radiatus]KAI8098996.1 hypothetical protein BX664DRAFT_310009 [Halteromyces radiatus]
MEPTPYSSTNLTTYDTYSLLGLTSTIAALGEDPFSIALPFEDNFDPSSVETLNNAAVATEDPIQDSNWQSSSIDDHPFFSPTVQEKKLIEEALKSEEDQSLVPLTLRLLHDRFAKPKNAQEVKNYRECSNSYIKSLYREANLSNFKKLLKKIRKADAWCHVDKS